MLDAEYLDSPALFDSSVWTWSRDKRFPELAVWLNDAVERGVVLLCDLVIMELLRLAPNERLMHTLDQQLRAFRAVPMPAGLWGRVRGTQRLLASSGDHRRVPPTDLLIAAAAEAAGVPLIHYDRDYARIGAVSELDQRWFVPDGSLTPAA